jgi:L-alanine-DL-glutamate epimerase-like enolase superfamily enzyme
MTDVQITDVEAFYLRLPQIAERTDSSQDSLIIRVSTDAGVTGYGEVDSCPLVAKAVIEAPYSHTLVCGLRHILLGKSPLDTDRLWDLMYASTLYYGREGAAIHAMAGVDLALWDIKGKLLGQPIHTLLGGAHRDKLRAYASHMFDFDPADTARRAAEAADHGFTAVKFGWEPMGPDAKMDEKLVSGIRNAVGPDVDVCVDAGLAWDAKTAISRCELFAPYNIFWLEEPLHPDDRRGYRKLTSAVSTRIAAGEEECTEAGFLRLMDEGNIDVIQVDLTRVGFTQARRIARLAEQRGIPVANHNFTTDINVAASLHFLASIPNAIMLEYCVEPSPLRTLITADPIQVIDGYAAVPEGPGLGIEVNLQAVEQYLVRS